MGFLNDDNDTIFLYVSRGFLTNKTMGIKHRGFTGYLEKIEKKEGEWEGKPSPQIRVHMKSDDSDQRVAVTFSERSWFCFAFFNRLVQINFEKPFTFGVLGDKEKEKVTYCFMRQNKELVKAVKAVPEPDKVPVPGSDPVTNWTKPMERYTGIIDGITKKLESIGPHPEVEVSPVEEPEPPLSVESQEKLGLEPVVPTPEPPIVEDDLPF